MRSRLLKKGRFCESGSDGYHMRKRRAQGFTLVETIVVLVILAILMAIAVPAFLGYIEKGKETACQSNRRNLRLQLMLDRLEQDQLSKSELEEGLAQTDIRCPSGGVYTIEFAKDFDTTRNFGVICSIHGGEVPGEGAQNRVSQGLRRDFIEYIDEIPQKKRNNDAMRKAFFEAYGGQWPTLTVDGTVYYIQPYYSEKASDSLALDQRVWLYATTDPGTKNNWSVPFVLDPVEMKWYTATGWSGKPGGSANISATDAQSMHALIQNEMHGSTDRHKWVELADYTESAPVK